MKLLLGKIQEGKIQPLIDPTKFEVAVIWSEGDECACKGKGRTPAVLDAHAPAGTGADRRRHRSHVRGQEHGESPISGRMIAQLLKWKAPLVGLNAYTPPK